MHKDASCELERHSRLSKAIAQISKITHLQIRDSLGDEKDSEDGQNNVKKGLGSNSTKLHDLMLSTEHPQVYKEPTEEDS